MVFLKYPSKLLKILFAYKIVILILVAILALAGGALRFRETLKKPALSLEKHGIALSNYLPLPADPPASASATPTPTKTAVLGTSTGTSDYKPYTPPPIPTFTPQPTPTPATTSSPIVVNTSSSSSSSCSGTPNADNSQVYVTPSTTSVNSSATIKVELMDCNKNHVSNDKLEITLTSGSNVTINGTSVNSPYQAQAQNGYYSFQVSSSSSTTAIFKIRDTDKNFEVTMPGYKPPKVTFSSSASSSSGCTAQKYAAYSDAYFPSSPITVGTKVTITIDLRDCNRQATLGSDTITVTPKSVDPGFQFVGHGSGAFTLSQGQTSFQVTAQNPSTNTFTIWDSTKNFEVTGPNYATPTVTFVSSTSTATPTPTPTQSGPTATPTPTGSPTPTPTSTPSPSLSPSPTLSPTP